jgi:hypothetical protein
MITVSEFEQLTREEQASTLCKLKDDIGVKRIVNVWGISKDEVYSKLRDLNIPLRKKSVNPAPKAKVNEMPVSKPSKVAPLTVGSMALQLESKPTNIGEINIAGNAAFIKELLNQIFNSPAFDNSQIQMMVKVEG